MVKLAVLDLNDSGNHNKWIIGTRDPIQPASPFYSGLIQIKYNKLKREEWQEFLEREEWHRHLEPIEEYYLVINGAVQVKVDNDSYDVQKMQVLCVPSNHCHKVEGLSGSVEYFTIRVPISCDHTKEMCIQQQS